MNFDKIRLILEEKPHNPHYLDRYLRFLNYCVTTDLNYKGNTEKHHICPASKTFWPEYKSFSKNPWNKIDLTPRQHYIAHYILARCYGAGMWFAFNMMCNQTMDTRKYKVSSTTYQELKENISKLMTGRVVSEETKQKQSISASEREPHKYTLEKMKESVKDSIWIHNGIENKRISKDDINLYENWETGRVPFSDDTKANMSKGKIGKKKPPVSDSHRKNLGKTVKGKVVVRDTQTGKKFRCDVNDPNYISGRYIHHSTGLKRSDEQKEKLKGWITVRDTLTGEKLKCRKDDPHYLSGRYVGHTKGVKVKCPHCDKEGGKGVMIRWHFDNCKYKKS